MENNKEVDYSIIIPVYCNEGSLNKLYETLLNEVIQHNKSKLYELIFVDDGSLDSSFDQLMAIKSKI